MGQALHVSTNGSSDTTLLDYQRFPTMALNENALSEPAGLGTPLAHNYFVQWVCPQGSNRNPSGGLDNTWPGDRDIDWNCTGDDFYPDLPGSMSGIDPDPVTADINGDGQLTTLQAWASEWAVLDYRSGRLIGPAPKQRRHHRATVVVD